MIKKLKIIVGVFALAAVISYFVLDANEKEFNQVEWKKSPTTRYKMAQDIVESEMLIGKEKEAVLNLLGVAILSTLKRIDFLTYDLGTTPNFFETKEEMLFVIFEDGKVIKVIQPLE